MNATHDEGNLHVRAFTRQDGVVILGGLLAGVLGSIALLVVAMTASALSGEGPIFPIKLIATTAFGPEVAHEAATASVIVTGALIHVLVGAGFGIMFGYLADGMRLRTVAEHLLAGVVYGVAVYLAMFLYVVPLLAPLLSEQLPFTAAALGHVAFGATLGLYWPIAERLHRGDEDLTPIPLPVI